MKSDTLAPYTRLIPLARWETYHTWPTNAALRFYVFNRHTNGFDEHNVVKRVGRRILIDESAFFRWVDAQPGNKTGGAA